MTMKREPEPKESYRGRNFPEVLAKAAGEAAMADARALRNSEYKIELAKALIRQALRAIASKD